MVPRSDADLPYLSSPGDDVGVACRCAGSGSPFVVEDGLRGPDAVIRLSGADVDVDWVEDGRWPA